MASVRKSTAKTEAFDLQAIADAIEDGDGTSALEAALVAWRQTHAPALADLVTVISTRISGAPVETEAEFTAAARARDAVVIGRLLPAIREMPVSFLPTAAQLLVAFPADPRIANAIASWALDPPTTSSSTFPFWTKCLDYLGRSGDTRAIAIAKQRLKKSQGGSKFWPKLYAGLEKAVNKLGETTVVPVDDKAIAKLANAATKLDPVTPRVATQTNAPNTKAPRIHGPPLEQAVQHLEAGRVQAAIDAMLDAWRALDRAPAIADTIDRATRLLPTWDQPLGRTQKAVAEAWSAAFADDPQAVMPQLLEHLDVGGPAVAERHLVELASLPEDPRIGMRLAELCAGRTASPERTQYWKSLLEIIARVRDPRTAEALCETFGNFEGTYYNHHKQARRLIAEWAKAPPIPSQLGPSETAALNKIGALLGKAEAKRDTIERDLIKAIVDGWSDDGPRLVYADWLTERQHPRGDAIVNACAPKGSDKEQKRIRTWLRNAPNLYGVLEDVSNPWRADRDLGLDRGMPTKIHAVWSTSRLFWRKLVGYPLLATIETIQLLSGDLDRKPPVEDFARVLSDPTAVRLGKLQDVSEGYARQLSSHLTGWKLQGKHLVRA